MKAMLLSAGFGERMLPLTGSLPKPAIPVLGRPLAVQVIRWLLSCEPRGVVLNLHHLPDVLEDLLGDGSDFGLPPIAYSREEVLLGTAGGVRKARPLLLDDHLVNTWPVIVTNSDFLSDINLPALLAAHRGSGALATLVLVPHRPPYSVVEVGAGSRILSLAGVPETDPAAVTGRYLFTGCQVIAPEVFDRIPHEGPSDLVRHVYRDLAREGRLGAYVHEGFWWEFGSPELYLQGSMRLLEQGIKERRRITDHDPARRIGGAAVAAIGPGARYHPASTFRGRIALGFASHVSEKCEVEDSVIMPEAWIGPGSRLHCCVVGPAVEVPAGFDGSRLMICNDPDPGTDYGPPIERVGGLLLRPLDPEVLV